MLSCVTRDCGWRAPIFGGVRLLAGGAVSVADNCWGATIHSFHPYDPTSGLRSTLRSSPTIQPTWPSIRCDPYFWWPESCVSHPLPGPLPIYARGGKGSLGLAPLGATEERVNGQACCGGGGSCRAAGSADVAADAAAAARHAPPRADAPRPRSQPSTSDSCSVRASTVSPRGERASGSACAWASRISADDWGSAGPACVERQVFGTIARNP